MLELRADRDAAHHLDAAGHGHVDDARADQRGGQVGGLLAASRTACRRWWPRSDSGRPAASHAVRVTLKLCSPTWLTQPPTTWPISAGIDPGALDDGLLDRAEQLGRVDGWTGRRRGARRGADGVDDDNVAHGESVDVRIRSGPGGRNCAAVARLRRGAVASRLGPRAAGAAARLTIVRRRLLGRARATAFVPSLLPPAEPADVRWFHVGRPRRGRDRRPAEDCVADALPRHARHRRLLGASTSRWMSRSAGRRRVHRPARTSGGCRRWSGPSPAGPCSSSSWARTHRFCGRCGDADRAGSRRAGRCAARRAGCSPTRGSHRPSSRWSRGATRRCWRRGVQFPVPMYSCLAGFVEPGESLEEAVRGRCREEVGLSVDEVVYKRATLGRGEATFR